MPAVEPAGIGAEEPFHASDQIGLGSFHHQMKMVVHQAISQHLPVSLFTTFPERLQKAQPVLVIMENGFAPVAPAHHVVNRSGIFHSEFPGHAGRLEEPSRLVHTIFDNAGLTPKTDPEDLTCCGPLSIPFTIPAWRTFTFP